MSTLLTHDEAAKQLMIAPATLPAGNMSSILSLEFCGKKALSLSPVVYRRLSSSRSFTIKNRRARVCDGAFSKTRVIKGTMEPLLRTDDAAGVLGLSPKTLHKWRFEGRGPNYLKMGGAVRYEMATLKAFAGNRGLPGGLAARALKLIRSSTDGDRYVYFIATEDLTFLKIGTAGQVHYRMESIQTGCPLKLRLIGAIRGYTSTERQLHKLFARYRTQGEWFKIQGPVRSFVNAIKEGA